MTRTSQNEYDGQGRLVNGYDYDNQAWVIAYRYVRCGHPETMNCGCYGRRFAGLTAEQIERPRTAPTKRPGRIKAPFHFEQSSKGLKLYVYRTLTVFEHITLASVVKRVVLRIDAPVHEHGNGFACDGNCGAR